jgi:predicted nuclease with TOPRIM domain
MYSAELIEIYPELNEYIDKENGLLVITEEQWQKIYDAKLKNIKLQARQERIIELEKEQIKTAEKIKEAQDKVTEAYEVYMDAIDRKMKLPVLIEETSKLLDKLIQSKGATDDLTEAEKLLLDEYTNGSGKADDLRQAIIKLYEEYGKADGNIEKTRGAYDELKGKLQELQTEYNNTGKVIEDINKGVYDNIQSVVDNTKVSPITIPVQISSRGVQSGLADIWKKGAISVNDNPLLLPVRPAGISYAEWEAGILKGYNSIRGFAEGGLPDVGTLFYAGEAGAEVVANMGHSTGVMNISQMQEAVADGNTEVVNAIYAMANMITGAVNNKDFDVYMDSAKVGQSVSKYQYNQARRGITQGGY